MSHQHQQQQQQQPAAFVNKPARGWLHPDHLIAKVGPCIIVIGVADPACLSRIQIFPIPADPLGRVRIHIGNMDPVPNQIPGSHFGEN